MGFWKGKNVIVTGANGFIGSHIIEELLNEDAKPIAIVRNKQSIAYIKHLIDKIEIREADLQNEKETIDALKNAKIIINCAAKVGGIKYNIDHPGSIFRDNMKIFMNVLETARINNTDLFITVSSACVYPRFCTIPTPESEGFLESPEPTNEGYGWSKRMEEFMSISYAKEFKMKIGIVRPYNGYGPRDNFDTNTSHVIPSLIRRIIEGEDPLIVWGSGNQTRSFLYSRDFAKGILKVGELYAIADPINIGVEREISIKEIVELICKITNKHPKIIYDTSKPEGQPRRNCDTKKMQEKLLWHPDTKFEDGLRETIIWYEKWKKI